MMSHDYKKFFDRSINTEEVGNSEGKERGVISKDLIVTPEDFRAVVSSVANSATNVIPTVEIKADFDKSSVFTEECD